MANCSVASTSAPSMRWASRCSHSLSARISAVADGEAGRERHVAVQAQQAEQEGDQRGDLGGDADLAARGGHHVGRDHERGHRAENRERQPRQQQHLVEIGRHGTGERDEPDGAHAGEAESRGLLALALQAEQHAQAERGTEPQGDGDVIHMR